ncbi:MAG TPA: MraY family glycosyltransferase [Pirellulaceae bacterium]|nr:undecaprenyl/decaprenyl-phosphate alpha-N-acetylglucosaminyl 1-phosphate transferase [Planctomycetales bacterium]HRX77748.1 MraY family glycosyltransferase [Pirellulaceae bacterium]
MESVFWLVASSAFPSFMVAFLTTFVIRQLALRWGLVDRPNHRKVHATPVPLGGGIAIAIGVVLPFAIGTALLLLVDNASLEKMIPAFALPHLGGLRERLGGLWVMLGGALVLMMLGLIDDRRGLDWRVRLFVQFAVATACVATQGWQLTAFISVPKLGSIISISLSVIWIVALINSFNMLDNMDGLSAGVAAIAASILATVMLISPAAPRPQLFVAGFLFVLVGALLGFLIHNRPPAKIFMGDAGSYFVGFSIAIATLLATFAGYSATSPGAHAVLAPLCVMAVPLYDMTTVIWIRLREGRSPFEADKNHFSHRLVELGLSKPQAVLTIYLTTATCGLGALLLHQVDLFGAFVVALLITLVLLLIAILESTRRGSGKS